MSSPLDAEVSYLYDIRDKRQTQSMQGNQRDPRKRRGDNNSDMDKKSDYTHSSSRERRESSDLYPQIETAILKKSKPDRVQRERSPRGSLSRSRSRSPSLRGGNSVGRSQVSRDPRVSTSNTRDEWTKTTDAFLKNLGAASSKSNEQTSYIGRSDGGYPSQQHSGYTAHGASSHEQYYSNQHSSSMGLPPMNVPPPGISGGFSGHHSSQDNVLEYNVERMGRSGGGRALSPHDMSSRNIESEPTSFRDDRKNIGKENKRKSHHGNGNQSDDGSSDTSSSLHAGERRQKEKAHEFKRKEPIAGITLEQKEKLMSQQKQYIDAKLKLEDQLLKLKEEREELKERGNKHEDKIMRENAKLQKEVKTRVQYVVEVLGKIEAGLKMPIIRNDRQPSSGTPEREERRVRRMSPDGYRDSSKESRRKHRKEASRRSVSHTSSREPSEDKEKKKRKKRKEPSSSEDDDSETQQQQATSKEDRRKPKKKRKRSKKTKGSSSDLSDSESGKNENFSNKNVGSGTGSKGVIQVDESIFRMMATMNGSKSDGQSGIGPASGKGGSSDDMVVGLLSKMSEAYMASKKQNDELVTKVTDLENHNEELERKVNKQQRKLDKLKRKLQKHKQYGRDSDFDPSDKEPDKGQDKRLMGGRSSSHERKKEVKRALGSSNSNDHIPDILLGDVLKIQREGTLSPSTSRSSSLTRNSATAAAAARVVQSIDSFKEPKKISSNRTQSPMEEKREISIRGASPLRQPPERLTKQDAEIVRSVRNRMMEKEMEHKKRITEEERESDSDSYHTKEIGWQRGENWEMETERETEKNQDRTRRNEIEQDQESQRERERENKRTAGFEKLVEREDARNLERDMNIRERGNEIKQRSRSKEMGRARECSGSRDWDRGRRQSGPRSRERSKSKDMSKRSKSRERSKSPEERGRRRERSRSHSYERYERRYDERRDERSRFGFDNRRDARQREVDRFERRQREKDREREREKENERDRPRTGEKDSEEERNKDRSRLIKEKNDKINIDEWTTKPSDTKNPALMSIKEKLRQKEEEEEADNKRRKEQREEEKTQKWSNISSFSEQQKLEPPKATPEVARPQVAIQWGQRDKITPDPQISGVATSNIKKSMPMVGKMPWLQRNRKSEERQNISPNISSNLANATIGASMIEKKASRFGPPSAVITSLPPPMVLSSVPPPSSIQSSIPVAVPVPPPVVHQIQPPLQSLDNVSSDASGLTDTGSVLNSSNNGMPSITSSHLSSLPNNSAPSQVDINSMLEAAKEHINRVREESKKEQTSISQQLDSRARQLPTEIEIPLPPLPAAKDKDPSAMLDTRTEVMNYEPGKDQKSEAEIGFEKNGKFQQNLPPGFNPNVPTVTVQHTPSVSAHQPPILSHGPALQGPQGSHYYGPAPAYYGGHPGGPLPHMRGHQFHGRSNQIPQNSINEAEQKAEKSEEPDAAELAMLGIDPSDFAGFGE